MHFLLEVQTKTKKYYCVHLTQILYLNLNHSRMSFQVSAAFFNKNTIPMCPPRAYSFCSCTLDGDVAFACHVLFQNLPSIFDIVMLYNKNLKSEWKIN
jgi:hypothetical protein